MRMPGIKPSNQLDIKSIKVIISKKDQKIKNK